MKLWKKITLSIVGVVAIGVGSLLVMYQVKNQPAELREPNYYTYYQQQDKTPVGKVGIYISQMILPEEFKEEVYYNVFFKPLTIIPWPIRELLRADNGMPLYDTERYFEFKEFTPTKLVDYKGRDTDTDGVTYIEKYRRGDITFVDGKDGTPGFFLLESTPAGMPTRAAELITKARVYYHGDGAGLVGGKVPEESSIKKLIAKTMAMVERKYGEVDWRWANTEIRSEARQAMFELLDNGADTIVFAPPRPIMSHYEEFNASVRNGMEYIAEWEAQNGKSIQKIIAPQLAEFPALRQAYLNLLRYQLDQIPADKSVKVVASFHGMPWDLVKHEAWLELSKPYLAAMMQDLDQLMTTEYSFSRWETDLTQDYFAEMTDLYQSTNESFWQGVKDDYDYVINMPVEFITENTDTLFAHAFVNFKGFEGFDVYEPIDYPDWDQPLVRKVEHEDTTLIYTSVPVGKFNGPLVKAHFQSIDSILSQSLQPLASWQDEALLELLANTRNNTIQPDSDKYSL